MELSEREAATAANRCRLAGRFDEAQQHLENAAALHPASQALRLERAFLLRDRGQPQEAIACLQDQANPDAVFALAQLYLSIGDYTRGWALHRRRWDSSLYAGQARPPFEVASVTDVIERPVVVLREGGHGDVFQMVRYIPLLAGIAKHVLLFVLPSELRLLQNNLPANVTLRVCESRAGAPLHVEPEYRHAVALLDLPYIFRTTLATIPARLHYIVAPQITAMGPRPRIGLCWSGGKCVGTARQFDALRSIDAKEFAVLRDARRAFDFVSLQQEDAGEPGALSISKVIKTSFDWADTASVIAGLDLVITVDTAIAHLAAAMGKPTWVLSRYTPCWRWLCNEPHNPWYPGVARVFGQTSFGDWTSVLRAVKSALKSEPFRHT